jgi:hypothetical protein
MDNSELTHQFCKTANTLTHFYKTSLDLQKKAFESGKNTTIENLVNFIKNNSNNQLSGSTGNGI